MKVKDMEAESEKDSTVSFFSYFTFFYLVRYVETVDTDDEMSGELIIIGRLII